MGEIPVAYYIIFVHIEILAIVETPREIEKVTA